MVEIKSDDDDDESTPAKEKYAKEHFEILNEKLRAGAIPAEFIRDNDFLERQLYTFDLLVPARYDAWFADLKKGQNERYTEFITQPTPVSRFQPAE